MTQFLGDDAQFHALGAGDVAGVAAVPIGGSMIWWSDTLPSGPGTWLWLNGQSLLQSGFPALFAILGTTYGGDATHFSLPDLRDNVPVGKGTMGGTSAAGRITHLSTSTLGNQIGEAQHTLSSAEIPAHTHTATSTQAAHSHALVDNSGKGITALLGAGGSPDVSSATAGNDKNTVPLTGIGTDSKAPTITTTVNANTGGGGAHNNVQPSLVCGWVIRAL